MASSALDDLLRQWELSALSDRMRENGINEKTLRDLDEKLISELIPEIGYRATFIRHWRALVKKSSSEFPQSIDDTNESTSDPDTISNSGQSEGDLHQSGQSENTLHQSDNALLTRQNCFIGEDPFRRIQRCGVKKLLQKSIPGRLVLDAYKRTKTLTRKSRAILVDALMSQALDELNGRLVNEDFEFLSQDIVKVFPTELAETYYIAPVKKRFSKSSRSITARGKLVDKYRNKNRDYRRLTGSKLCESLEIGDAETTSIEDLETVKASVTWLEKNQAPWESVVEHWKKTTIYRREQIREITDKSVHGIIEIWPILKNPTAYILIEEDFASLKLTEKSIGLDDWKLFFQKLLSCRPATNLGTAANELIDILHQEYVSDEDKVTAQLLLLSFLVPPRGRVRAKKTQWKPTTIECRDSMIVHVKIPGDITRLQEQRSETMNTLGLTVQPFIIVVGETLTKIQTFLVCVDTILYEVKSAVRALDLCFKTFFVLDAAFPAPSEHLWFLLQVGLYDFSTKYDKKISYVMEIITAIKAR